MKKILQGKTGTIILASVAGLVVAIGLTQVLDVDEWYVVRGAIQEIARGGDIAKARTRLQTLGNRAYVLEKLQEAIGDDSYGIRAKYNLLTELTVFGQPRAIPRALDAPSATTRRAACWMLWTDAEMKARCAEIALEWLKDDRAEGRAMAATICGRLDVPGSQEVLLGIAMKDPRTEGERDLFKQALASLKDPKPAELVDRLLRIAGDDAMESDIRATTLESLQRMKEGQRDKVLQLSLDIVADAGADRILRNKAVLGLREFPEERAWQALEAVVLSEKETDRILQRGCLYTLGQMEPADKEVARRYLDRLRQLLVDRRVYDNPYFAIKVDVATALAVLNARDAVTFDIMCRYLVDEDRDDRDHLVRQEAWLTLWVLTGTKLPDLPEPELFQLAPRPFLDPLAARPFLFSRLRPGITRQQQAMVGKIAGDLSLMQKHRQIYQGFKAKILEQWRVEAEAAEQGKAAEGPKGPAPQGPKPPGEKKEEGCGEEPGKEDGEGCGEPGDPEKDG